MSSCTTCTTRNHVLHHSQGGLLDLAEVGAKAAREAVKKAMLGPEPEWLKGRPVLKKEFEVCAANGGGALSDSGSDAEGDSDDAGEPVRLS